MSMKNVHDGLSVENMSDLVLKQIYSIYETKNPMKEQIKKCKKTEREVFEKYANLSEDRLSEKSNKNVYVKNDVVSTVIKRCRGEKKRGEREIDGFRKKLMIPGSEITECPEHKVKSKIGKIFVNRKILEEYSVKVYEIDPYSYEHYKEKIQVDKSGCKYIFFRIDVYFIKYLIAVEIDEKGYTDRDLIFEKKRQEALKKKLGCKFIRINASKESYDADYEATRTETFISKFKEKQLKKLNKKIKKLEDRSNHSINENV